jgi:hypothetical protein
MRFYYSILGLNPTKGFDVVIDQSDELVAVQSDVDCKKTHFSKSLLPVHLFFSMFDSLTEYKGLDEGNHKFKIRQFDESNELSPRFYFFFDKDLKFIKSRIEQIDIGGFDFSALIPF